MIAAIFAVDRQGGIGKDGTLPWPKNSEDLNWFKEHTTGHVVVMGGKTWRDPLFPKPLPNRLNVVITSQPIDTPGVLTISGGDFRSFIKRIEKSNPEKKIFIIGGADIISKCIDMVSELYLTTFLESYECDTFINIDLYLEDFTKESAHISGSTEYSTWKRIT